MECQVMNSLELPSMAINRLFRLSLPSGSWAHENFHCLPSSSSSCPSWVLVRFGSETMCRPYSCRVSTTLLADIFCQGRRIQMVAKTPKELLETFRLFQSLFNPRKRRIMRSNGCLHLTEFRKCKLTSPLGEVRIKLI
jgi:hypothetical protein